MPRTTTTAAIKRQKKEAQTERLSKAGLSLEKLKITTSLLIRQYLASNPGLNLFFHRPEDRKAPAGSLGGFTREQALDFIMQLSEGIGLNPTYGKIMRGAAVVIEIKGVDATGIEEILRSAGVSRRTFYQFFGNKVELLDAYYDLLTACWIETLRDLVGRAGTPEQKLKRYVRLNAWSFGVAGRLVPVLITEAVRPGSSLNDRFRVLQRETIEILQPVYEEAMGKRADPLLIRAEFTAIMAIAIDLELGPDSEPEAIETAEILMRRMVTPIGCQREDVKKIGSSKS